MKKTITWILILLSILVLIIRFSSSAKELLFGIKPKSGISVLSIPEDATVSIDGKDVGKTPFEDKNLDVKEYLIKIEKGKSIWQAKVNLVTGTVVVINRDLSPDEASSAGEILTLKKGSGITVVSNPSDATVSIDGKDVGKTPNTFKLEPGEHTILLSHANFLNRSIKAKLPDNFNLTISSDLAVSEADLTTIATPVITQTPEVIVKETPTGFLRVRDKASLNGKEIAQVKPGDELVLLEELPSWDRIRLSNNIEGYISSSYVEKKKSQ